MPSNRGEQFAYFVLFKLAFDFPLEVFDPFT
jgi:hypothetical protein